MKRLTLVVAVALSLFGVAQRAAAQDADRVRLALDVELNLVAGPTLKGIPTPDEPSSPETAPFPAGAAFRVEVPLQQYFVLGARAGVLGWTSVESTVGYPAHVLLDLGLFPKLRYHEGLGSGHDAHEATLEVYTAFPFGLSLDYLGERDRALTPERAGWSTGVHLGMLVGIQRHEAKFGWYVEAGSIWRSIVYSLAYENDAGASRSYDISAHPVSLFIGTGFSFGL